MLPLSSPGSDLQHLLSGDCCQRLTQSPSFSCPFESTFKFLVTLITLQPYLKPFRDPLPTPMPPRQGSSTLKGPPGSFVKQLQVPPPSPPDSGLPPHLWSQIHRLPHCHSSALLSVQAHRGPAHLSFLVSSIPHLAPSAPSHTRWVSAHCQAQRGSGRSQTQALPTQPEPGPALPTGMGRRVSVIAYDGRLPGGVAQTHFED